MRASFCIVLTLLLLLPGIGLAADLDTKQAIEAISLRKLSPGDELVFIVVGDSRNGDDVYTALLDQALSHDPWFVLHTGDMVYRGEPGELEHYETLIAGYPLPIIHIPGNHDVNKGNTAFRDFGGLLNWSFDIGQYRFIGLDTSTWNLTDEAMEFAQVQLGSPHQFFVAFHHPPYVGRWQVHAMSPDEKGGRGGELMQLLKQVHTRAVFLGHIHLRDEMRIGGIPYFISGGGGVRMAKKYGFGMVEHGYLVIRAKYGIVDYEWVPLK